MALTPNVGTGQVIESTWGNEIRDRTVQVFTNKAQLDAEWGTAPNGAQAHTTDIGADWFRKAGAWRSRSTLMARVYRNGAWNPVIGSVVPMDTVGDDPSTMLSAGGLVLPVAGPWLVISSVSVTGPAGVTLVSMLMRAGADFASSPMQHYTGGTGGVTAQCSALMMATAGQKVEVKVTFIAAGPTGLTGGHLTWLSAQYLGP